MPKNTESNAIRRSHREFTDQACMHVQSRPLVLPGASFLLASMFVCACISGVCFGEDPAPSALMRRIAPPTNGPSVEIAPLPSLTQEANVMANAPSPDRGDGGPWWSEAVYKAQRDDAESTPIRLEEMLAASLVYSPYVQVIKELPLIRETSVTEADAEFDWLSFVESLWSDISEPVGSRLTTGGPERLRDHNITTSGGVRRRNRVGGQFEIAQRFGYQDTNSVFFVPPNQGTSRVTVNYTQPLLRTAGRSYNTALTCLATIDVRAAESEFSEELQGHLVEVTRAYWNLYLQRANLLQKTRLLRRAEEIYEELDRRREIDALRSQIVRARAAVESRRSEIVRSRTEVRNAESRLRTLVNAPQLGDSLHNELIPLDRPIDQPWDVDLTTSVETALRSRPEISNTIQQIRAAGVRLRVAKNEILPALNLILESYVSGLRGNSNVGGAWLDQWRRGEPTYSIGLQYEFPIWNRAAQARYKRRRLELRQLESQLRTTIENLRFEVEVSVREVSTTYGEMRANYRAMEAAEADVNYLYDRWQTLPGTERTASLYLEDLLDSQERLNAAEFAFLDAQNNFSVSHVQYLRSVGTLLEHENITIERYCECHLPNLALHRHGSSKFEVVPQGDTGVEQTLVAPLPGGNLNP